MSEDQQAAYDWLVSFANEVKGGSYGDGEAFDMDEFIEDLGLAMIELEE